MAKGRKIPRPPSKAPAAPPLKPRPFKEKAVDIQKRKPTLGPNIYASAPKKRAHGK